ncbi:hypothetical protein FQA47_021303 [Oryzias melastigma]|uniref:Uncharacterized protein n=1 Tax=Oryzias melastigma TaxID=30732 RepID=A0A834F9P2_ORYME|nr:hypothetical protein FQA47_021303 [Oryzias melastigma]
MGADQRRCKLEAPQTSPSKSANQAPDLWSRLGPSREPAASSCPVFSSQVKNRTKKQLQKQRKKPSETEADLLFLLISSQH